MSDFETRLAEARKRLARTFTSPQSRRTYFEGFDTCGDIAREVVAEKDAEIARLQAQLDVENFCGACCPARASDAETPRTMDLRDDEREDGPLDVFRHEMEAAEEGGYCQFCKKPFKVSDAQRKLDAIRKEIFEEHFESDNPRDGCAVCGGQDGYRWPCTTRKIIDEHYPVEPAQRKAHRVEMRPEYIKPPTPEAIKAAEEAYGFKALIEPALSETDDKP